MDDRIEVDNWFDPLEGDADHDGRLDLQELAEGTNPRVYNKHGWDYVAAFLKGYMGGDFIRDAQDSTVMAGRLIGSFVPFIDVRDVVANTIHIDPGMTGLSLIGLIPVFGDATGSAGKCVKYVSQYADYPSIVLELLTFLEKSCPDIAKEVVKSDDFIPAMEKLAKSDLSKLTKAEREALEALYEKIGLKSLLKADNLIPNQGFSSFADLKKAIGSAGIGNDWHHIVEQAQIGKSGFSPEQIHNTSNIIAVDHATHMKITGYYNTKSFDFTNGLSVREWLAGQSYEEQYSFGLNVLRQFGVIK